MSQINADRDFDPVKQGEHGRAIQLERQRREAESAQAHVARIAAEERAKIAAAFIDALTSENHRVRLDAARRLLEVEGSHLDRQAQRERDDEHDEIDRMTVAEQVEMFRQLADEINAMVGDEFDIIDGEIVEPHRPALGR